MTPLAPHFRAIDCAALADARKSRRRFAERYVRSAEHLLYWTFPASREVVMNAINRPHNPDVTWLLCRYIYRDIQTAKALPEYLTGRQNRIDELRRIFTAECWVYFQQRARSDGQQRMNEFLNGLAAE